MYNNILVLPLTYLTLYYIIGHGFRLGGFVKITMSLGNLS